MGLCRARAIERHITADGNCVHPPLKDFIFGGLLEGNTPLLLACTQGNIFAVQHMIDHWGVDIQSAATYYHHFEDELLFSFSRRQGLPNNVIRGATPLFVAAVNGHCRLVDHLLKLGADVSVMTAPTSLSHGSMSILYGALTLLNEDWWRRVTGPLREKKTAAVLSLLNSGANPSALSKFPTWMTNLCISKPTAIISLLLEHGMRLDQTNPTDGSTILHHWVSGRFRDNYYTAHLDRTLNDEEPPLVVVKLLVEKGADLMARDKDGFTPILKAAHVFFPSTSHEDLAILDFLLEREGIHHRQEKIDALELIGAIILSYPESSHLFHLAFDYWRRAVHLRQLDDGAGPLPKTVMKQKSGLTDEWVTLAELENVIINPSELLLQSFLVRLRIYSSKSWDIAKSFIEDCFIRHFRPVYLLREFGQRLKVLWTMLGMILAFQPREEERFCRSNTARVIMEQMVDILSKLRVDDSMLTSKTIETSLKLILSVLEIQKDSRINTDSLFVLFKKLASHPEKLNVAIKILLVKLMKQSLKSFTPITFKFLHSPYQTLLQMVCTSFCSQPQGDLATAKLLLELGADPNDGSLHVVLSRYWKDAEAHDKQVSLARLLLNEGAHLDRINTEGKTAVDLWTEARNNKPEALQMNQLPDWCYEKIPKLMCLSSRVIRTHKIPFKDGAVPVTLHKFIEMH